MFLPSERARVRKGLLQKARVEECCSHAAEEAGDHVARVAEDHLHVDVVRGLRDLCKVPRPAQVHAHLRGENQGFTRGIWAYSREPVGSV